MLSIINNQKKNHESTMGNLLVQSKNLSDVVQSAMYHPYHNETYRVIDRLLPSTARENIPLSLILFKIEPFMQLIQLCEEQQIWKLIEGLLTILMEQTPDVVYVDCVEVNEFIVLIPAVNPDQALTAGDEICRRFHDMAKKMIRKKGLSLKLKGGLAVFPEDGENRLELFRIARAGIYQASQKARQTVIRMQNDRLISKSAGYASYQVDQMYEIASLEGVSVDSFLREAFDCHLKRFILPANTKRR